MNVAVFDQCCDGETCKSFNFNRSKNPTKKFLLSHLICQHLKFFFLLNNIFCLNIFLTQAKELKKFGCNWVQEILQAKTGCILLNKKLMYELKFSAICFFKTNI